MPFFLNFTEVHMKKIVFIFFTLFISQLAYSLNYGTASCPGVPSAIKGYTTVSGGYSANGGTCNGKPDAPQPE